MTTKVYGRLTPDPERLRLLEAVAEAAGADMRTRLDFLGAKGISFVEYTPGPAVSGQWLAVLKALAALEVHDGRV